jgi:Ca-activated chloride channel family protein
MNININDPKWTAYALYEITDERERMEMEAILLQSPEIAAMVEEIRETAGWLKEELLMEPAERLTPAQRERIEAKAVKTPGGFLFGWKPVWAYAAAVIVIAVIAALPFLQSDLSKPEPTLFAEVQEKSFPAQAADSQRYKAPEQSPIPHVPAENVPVATTAAAENGAAQKTANDAGALASDSDKFAAPAVIPVEPSTQQMDDAPLFATLIPPSTGIATAVRGADAGSSLLLPRVVATAAPSQPPPPPKPETASVLAAEQMALSGIMGRAYLSRDGIPATEIRQAPDQRRNGNFNTETYEPIRDNPFLDVTQNPLSTFSIDVDTASYSNMRRFLNNGRLPPKDSVRIEELVNYFDYDYQAPGDGRPFAANVEMTEAPWNPDNRLLRIGLKGREIAEGKRPASNLVFLIDVSGSMSPQNRLPLVRESMKMLVDGLTKSDRVAIVVYAAETRVLLPSTSGDQKARLRGAIDSLRAGGSTNGASGIQLAYKAAEENFIKGGVNRVILATDGDFNVGVTNRGDLTRLIEEKAKSGIFLTALGFGMDNYKDATLELLADKGRGNYAYIDTENEARKVLVEQMNSTLVAIAQDVKIQVEFNPAHVGAYRLLGYENRVMAKEDFNDDSKMAGVIGAGHVVTAFYELQFAGTSSATPGVDPLKYQNPPQVSPAADSQELATVKIRSKEPEKETSVLTEFAIRNNAGRFANASGDFKFAAAVASFGMMLRDSPYKGNTDYERIQEWAKAGKGEDRYGYREEFIRMVHRAASFPQR